MPRGGGVTMTPPDGGAVIRYRERLRPLMSVAAILDERATDKSFRVTSVRAVEPLVTSEGEYAAIVDVGGAAPMPVERTLGFVFGDDWYSEVTGTAIRRELVAPVRELVRKLVLDSRLMLGIRRRRFVYTQPPGWHGHTRLPLFVTWFPPEHPRDATSITVYPALPAPFGTDEEPHFRMIPIGPPASAEIIDELEPRTTFVRNGLVGCRWRFAVRDERGRAVHRDMVLMRDARYLYASYLDRDANPDEGLLAYQALLDSIRPVPDPGLTRSAEPLTSDWL